MNKDNTIFSWVNIEEQNINEQLDILEKYGLVEPYLASLVNIDIYPADILSFADVEYMMDLKEDSYHSIINFKREIDKLSSGNITVYHNFSNLKRILNDRYGKDYPEYFI